jgi:hypothetical protein
VNGGVRAWGGTEEVTTDAPAGSILGGPDAETCVLSPEGWVSCFWLNALLDEAVDKSPFHFDTTRYVDIEQSLALIAGVSDAGLLTVNYRFEDEPIAYLGQQYVQVSTCDDYWCMVDNVGAISCDHFPSVGVRNDGIMDPPSGEFLVVDVNEYFACGVRPTGEVVCWGHEDAPAFENLVRLD